MQSGFKLWACTDGELPASGRYGTYKLVQKQPGGEKLVAFTRILHRQKGDVLMDEVGVSSRCASSLEDLVVAGRLGNIWGVGGASGIQEGLHQRLKGVMLHASSAGADMASQPLAS